MKGKERVKWSWPWWEISVVLVRSVLCSERRNLLRLLCSRNLRPSRETLDSSVFTLRFWFSSCWCCDSPWKKRWTGSSGLISLISSTIWFSLLPSLPSLFQKVSPYPSQFPSRSQSRKCSKIWTSSSSFRPARQWEERTAFARTRQVLTYLQTYLLNNYSSCMISLNKNSSPTKQEREKKSIDSVPSFSSCWVLRREGGIWKILS